MREPLLLNPESIPLHQIDRGSECWVVVSETREKSGEATLCAQSVKSVEDFDEPSDLPPSLSLACTAGEHESEGVGQLVVCLGSQVPDLPDGPLGEK